METYGLLPLTEGHSKDYNQNYDASITNEFSGAAYRLHTLVRGVLRYKYFISLGEGFQYL